MRTSIFAFTAVLVCALLTNLAAAQGQHTVSTAWNVPDVLLYDGSDGFWWEEKFGGGSVSVPPFDSQNGTRTLWKVRVQIYGAGGMGEWDASAPIVPGDDQGMFWISMGYQRTAFPSISRVSAGAYAVDEENGEFPSGTGGSMSFSIPDTMAEYTDQAALDVFRYSAYSISWDSEMFTYGEWAINRPSGGMQAVFSGFVSVTYYWQ